LKVALLPSQPLLLQLPHLLLRPLLKSLPKPPRRLLLHQRLLLLRPFRTFTFLISDRPARLASSS
jgi:hypothetical protein